ncbi:unnamed protein product [Plutella xylostella]|uniref:(diamondback moth) hypothetical protein n=1 Tax=Plutella xylostella TaxID=51655 RepID=A0A8S4EJ75_PLUXY|nr:unnamed protein product [Plutella xylostella]
MTQQWSLLVVERDGWRCDKDFVGHRKAVTCARFNSNILVKEGKKCCCAAVGSRDRALSIWLTSLKRPLVVVHDLFTDSVLDISWSSDGLNLLACSSDGSVACIQFTNKEIGTPLTLEEKNAFYEKIYGKCLSTESTSLAGANLLLECPEIMLARETCVKDDHKLTPTKPQPTTPTSQGALPASSPITPLRPMDRQIETRTSDGKRRITPVFIPLSHALDPNESLGSAPVGSEGCFSTSSQSKSRIRVERRDDIVIHPNVSNHATPKADDNALDQRLRKRPHALPGPGCEAVSKRAPPPAPLAPPPAPLPAPALGAAGPVVRTAGARRVQVVNNACSTPYGALARLQLLPSNSPSNDPLWETYLGSSVNCIACDARYVCVSCEDGSLHAWRLHGTNATRVLPPVALMSKAVKLTLASDQLAVVTTAADLAIWDLASTHCVVKPLSFRNLLTHGVTVSNCTLLEDGNPMITLSNSKCYIYSKKLYSWVIWIDTSDPVWRACRGSACARPPAASPLYPPPRVAKTQPTPYNRGNFSGGATRSWLEAQVASCLHLRLPRDYKHWTLALVTHLITNGTEEQLRTILDDMLGPSHCTSTPKKWQSTVLGIKKHEMLEEMLAIIVRQLRWQRLYTEYSDQLKELQSTAAAAATSGMMNGH